MRAEQSIYELLTLNMESVDRFRRFGRSGSPIPATQTYRKVISNLFRDGIRVEKWILINERTNQAIFATTYNGETGSHYDVETHTEYLSWEHLRSRLEDYHFVAPDLCPICRPIGRRIGNLAEAAELLQQ